MTRDQLEWMRIRVRDILGITSRCSGRDIREIERLTSEIRDCMDRELCRPRTRIATEDDARRGLNDIWPGDVITEEPKS